ncbi:MAG: chlorohydrolase [Planctomycetaceae bacterium]|nr:MAG: chlorohydrolase [Planctomycetaceae bacterium]
MSGREHQDGAVLPVQGFRARWVIPMAGPPLENSVVWVQGRRIVGVEPFRGQRVCDLGNVAVLPGLINAHTHLEFSDLLTPLEPQRPFADWIRRVLAWREQRGAVSTDTLLQGLMEALQSGTTWLVDIATAFQPWLAIPPTVAVPRLFLLRELIGLTPPRCEQEHRAAEQFLQQPRHPPVVAYGLSPHAPYTVHPDLFADSLQLCRRAGCLVAVHLAETEAERELLANDRGELRALLEERGIWSAGLFGGRSWHDWLLALASLPHAFVVHGTWLHDAEQALFAQHPPLTLVYCPRTHAAGETRPHPWWNVLRQGGRVVIGTDSRATNPDLNLWRELQFLAQKAPPCSHLVLLSLVTTRAAEALGCGPLVGTLQPGAPADLVVINVASAQLEDELLIAEHQVHGVMLNGHWVVPVSATSSERQENHSEADSHQQVNRA